MMKNGRNSDLGKLIMSNSDSYNAIFNAVNLFAIQNKTYLDFRNDAFNRGFITLEDIGVKFTANINMLGDSVKFDAIIESEFSLSTKYKSDNEEKTESLWFRLTCDMIITDQLSKFKVNRVSAYEKEQFINSEYPATSNFVPIISKNDLDEEATLFLKKYYPEALICPMAVPVREIAAKLNLKIIDGYHISKENKIFGAICFKNCKAELYDANWNKTELDVEQGTIIVDRDTYFYGNIGCENNTIAHELFHFHRHRLYAKVQLLLDKDYIAACRCSKQPHKGVMLANCNSDSDWMEWQANAVAPKILMPKLMFEKKMDELFCESNLDKINNNGNDEKLLSIVKKLADFFQVSIQSTMIRMTELGIENLDSIYNNKYKSKNVFEIEPLDYFYEYKSNLHFRKFIDNSDFIYVENHCVINSEQYIFVDNLGRLCLSDYARENKEECCLQFNENFILNRKKLQELSLSFFRGEEQSFAKCKSLADDILNGKAYANSKVSPRAVLQKAQEFEERILNVLSADIGRSIANIIEIFKEEWNFDDHKIIAEIEAVTLITKKTLSDIKLNKTKPKKETILAFGVGLCLGYNITNELLKRAGYALTTSEEDFAYTFILTGYRQIGIDDANIILENYDVKPLGNLGI